MKLITLSQQCCLYIYMFYTTLGLLALGLLQLHHQHINQHLLTEVLQFLFASLCDCFHVFLLIWIMILFWLFSQF